MKQNTRRPNDGTGELIAALEEFLQVTWHEVVTTHSRRRELVDARKLYAYVAYVHLKRSKRLIAMDLNAVAGNVRYYIRDVATRKDYVHEYRQFLRRYAK